MERNRYRIPATLVFTSQTPLTQFLIHPSDCAIERITVSDDGGRAWAFTNFGVSGGILWYITDLAGKPIAQGGHSFDSPKPTSGEVAIQAIALSQTLLFRIGFAMPVEAGFITAVPDGVEIYVTATLSAQAVA